jgi:hypothetical protein
MPFPAWILSPPLRLAGPNASTPASVTASLVGVNLPTERFELLGVSARARDIGEEHLGIGSQGSVEKPELCIRGRQTPSAAHELACNKEASFDRHRLTIGDVKPCSVHKAGIIARHCRAPRGLVEHGGDNPAMDDPREPLIALRDRDLG